MKRTLMIAAALASLAFVSAPSSSQAASVGFSVRIGDPYRGAALHFRSEPDYDTRFADLDNVIMSPHIGSGSVETRNAMGFRALDNISAVLAGKGAIDPLWS